MRGQRRGTQVSLLKHGSVDESVIDSDTGTCAPLCAPHARLLPSVPCTRERRQDRIRDEDREDVEGIQDAQ